MRLPRTFTILAGLAAAVLMLSGCRAATPPATDPQLRQLAGDLDRLRGDNGLYLGGVDNRPGVYESAYGLTLLRSAGEPVRLAAAPEAVRSAFDADLQTDPLWNRYALALLEQAVGARLHTAADVTALLSWQTPDGYFRDPTGTTASPTDVGLRLATTEAALSALNIFGVRLDDRRVRSARAWLAAHPEAAGASLTQLRHAVQTAALLGVPPPADVASRLQAWWRSTGAAEHGPVRGDQLMEVCSYVDLAVGNGQDLTAQRASLLAALAPDREPPADPQLAAALAGAWLRLGGPAGRLAAETGLVGRHRLPGGLVSAVQRADGDLGASYQVEELRSMAGLPTGDATLLAALREQRADVERSGPGAAATWLAATAAAGGRSDSPDQTMQRRALADLPTVLSADTAAQWFADVVALHSIGAAVPRPRIVAWAPDTMPHRYALWLGVAGLALAGYPPAPLSAGPIATTVPEALDLLAHRSLHLAVAGLLAARATGWQADDADRTAIARSLAGLRGCPGAPALYRDAVGASDCTVASTLAAWTVGRTLGLPVG